jgi:hypothetical protein
MRLLVLRLAAVGAALSAVVVGTTLVPGGPFVPDWVIWPLFIGCLAVHLPALRGGARLRPTPRALVVPAAVLAVSAFALAMQAVLTSRGNPERHGNAYFLRDHTELTRVSRSEYRYAERKEERLFAGIALVFYLAAITLQFRKPVAGSHDREAPGRTPSAAGP